MHLVHSLTLISKPTRCMDDAILVLTENGHALIDPFVTLQTGFPSEWQMLFAEPPRQPFSKPSTRTSDDDATLKKKRKRDASPVRSANEERGVVFHEELCKCLHDAIADVRAQWIACSPNDWHKSTITATSSETDTMNEDLVKWGTEIGEINHTLDGDRDIVITPEALEGESRPYTRYSNLLTLRMASSGEEQNVSMMDLFQKVYHSAQGLCHTMRTPNAQYMIPPRSGFLLSEMKDWHAILPTSSKSTQNEGCDQAC